jgi:hypothetical protein
LSNALNCLAEEATWLDKHLWFRAPICIVTVEAWWQTWLSKPHAWLTMKDQGKRHGDRKVNRTLVLKERVDPDLGWSEVRRPKKHSDRKAHPDAWNDPDLGWSKGYYPKKASHLP